jgi:hypothetical protein
MRSLRESYKAADKRAGHKLYEILIPVSRIDQMLRDREKPNTETQWVYECGCPATELYRAKPYCPIHGMKLLRIEKET